MINYENQKTEIDEILERNLWFGVEEETKKVAPCPQMSCFECLFHDERDSCHCGLRSMKWLVSEYEEPKVDWSKVPIDTPVLAAMDKAKWYNFYFAGTDDRGNTYVYSYGRTSWSSKTAYDGDTVKVPYIKLAEVSDE